jgi:hypothetical protein
MGKQPFRPVTGPSKGKSSRRIDGPATISSETADRLFIGMMQDQARFGIRRSLSGSRVAVILSDFREALSPRIGRR